MDHPTRTDSAGAAAGDHPLGVPPGYDAPAAPAVEPADAAVCANCEAPLVGPYCYRCGQKASLRLVSVHTIMADALEDQLALNSALPRTIAALFLHPGRLTADYVRGRIVRYIPPMRLYLGASLLFFLALSFLTTPRVLRDVARADAERKAAAAAPAAAKPPASGGATSPAARNPAAAAAPRPASVDTVLSTGHGSVTIRTGESTPSWLKERLKAQEARLNAMSREDSLRTVLGALFNAAPKVVFILLPFFALILKVLYIRRRRLYAEHFVFALHLHAAAFAAFTVMLLARNGIVSTLLCTWLAVYTFIAMRRVYGQGWLRTTVKFVVLGSVYLMVLGVGAGIGAVVALLTI